VPILPCIVRHQYSLRHATQAAVYKSIDQTHKINHTFNTAAVKEGRQFLVETFLNRKHE